MFKAPSDFLLRAKQNGWSITWRNQSDINDLKSSIWNKMQEDIDQAPELRRTIAVDDSLFF